jgi:hypothetical protein
MKQIILLFASLALLACSGESEEAATWFDGYVNHPNGLVVSRPIGFDEQLTSNGFRFDESGLLRTPWRLSVERWDIAPEAGLPQKRLGDAKAYYRISESDGGSGGSEFELWAAKPDGAHWIVVIGKVQGEGEPSYKLAWELLKRARLESAATDNGERPSLPIQPEL